VDPSYGRWKTGSADHRKFLRRRDKIRQYPESPDIAAIPDLIPETPAVIIWKGPNEKVAFEMKETRYTEEQIIGAVKEMVPADGE